MLAKGKITEDVIYTPRDRVCKYEPNHQLLAKTSKEKLILFRRIKHDLELLQHGNCSTKI